jgi:integrase
MVLLTYRHGLRAAEVCDLRWDQVDFNGAVLHVRRVKNGTHTIQGIELRALRQLLRESPASPFSSSASAHRRSPRPASPG